jgi:NTE family protein
VVAVDVLGVRTPESADGPGFFEATFNSFQIMQNSIVRDKLALTAPDIYIKPAIENVRVLEFYKADTIYNQATPAADKLRTALRRQGGCLSRWRDGNTIKR